MERTVVGHGIDLPRSEDFFTFLRTKNKLWLSLTSPFTYIIASTPFNGLCSQWGLYSLIIIHCRNCKKRIRFFCFSSSHRHQSPLNINSQHPSDMRNGICNEPMKRLSPLDKSGHSCPHSLGVSDAVKYSLPMTKPLTGAAAFKSSIVPRDMYTTHNRLTFPNLRFGALFRFSLSQCCN